MTIECLIVGCGKIAGSLDNIDDVKAGEVRSHSSAYYVNSGTVIVGYVDVDYLAAKTLASKYHVDFYSCSIRDAILELKPQVVSVCTPDHAHFDVVQEILTSITPPALIFLEKPAVTNAEEFKTLIELSKKCGTKIIVNHSRRFDENYTRLKRIVRDRSYGDCIRVDCWYYGGWSHIGVHVIDTLQYLFSDVMEIDYISEITHMKSQKDMSIQGKFKFKESDIAVFLNHMDESNYQLFEFDFKFSMGRIRIENFEERFCVEKLVINELGERILMSEGENLTHIGEDKILQKPIANAIQLLVDIISDGRNYNDWSLENSESTMSFIWAVNQKVLT